MWLHNLWKHKNVTSFSNRCKCETFLKKYNLKKNKGTIRKIGHLMTKPTKWPVHPAKIQISLGIRPVWSGSSLSAWRNNGSLTTHKAHSKDSDQTGWMPRLIWVFAGRTATLLVLSWGGSNIASYLLCEALNMMDQCAEIQLRDIRI